MGELFTLYGKMNSGEGIELEEAKPYSDFINWLERQDIEEARLYWKNYLKGYKEKTQIPKINSITNNREYDRKEKVIEFSTDTTNKLKTLASQCSVTFNTLFQSIWGTVLAKYNST
ncbi:condensation domain-containing protein, partial [Pseudomonas sp. SIMBA_021]|uniref:condensation domain-containing protein n=1 Tax=Pseudomonas sp. SIMBA_021 TaxID=3085767 RepID=UPI00397AF7BC